MNQKASSGLSLPGLLFIIFLVLKLTKNIDWDWLWVTSPLWIPILLIASIALVGIVVCVCLFIAGYSESEIRKMLGAEKEENSKND